MAVQFDVHLPQLYDDEFFVAGTSQTNIKNSPWCVHFNGGFESMEQNVFVLSCVVTDNNDHLKPNLVEGTREFIVRIPKPFTPVRFHIWTPGKTDSYVCLVTFGLMHEDAERPDVSKLDDAPFVDAEECEPSFRWHWKDMPF